MTATAPGPRLALDLPPSFTGLPILPEKSMNDANSAELGRDISGHTGTDAPTFTRYLSWITEYLAGQDVRLFGKFAVDTEGEPALATLTMAVTPWQADRFSVNQRESLADSLLLELRRRIPQADARLVDLPIGEAVAAVISGEYRFPPSVTGAAEVVRQAFRTEFQIPSPDGKHLITIAVVADGESGWPEIAERSMALARSLRVEPGPVSGGGHP